MGGGLSIGSGVLWVLGWFGFMLVYTALNVALWRKVEPRLGQVLHCGTIALCMAVFLRLLQAHGPFAIHWSVFSLGHVPLAAACAALLYLVVDHGLDPLLEKRFPSSEASYQESLQALRKAPVSGLVQVCVFAPVMEEILMRGFLLAGWSVTMGEGWALVLSSLVFALLHFNRVQTLSALVCGLALGTLYLATGSLACCMLAHAGYNLISYCRTVIAGKQR